MKPALRSSQTTGRGVSAPEAHRRGLNVEVEALLAGVGAAILGGVFAFIVFGGQAAPIWADWSLSQWSIGMAAVVSVSVLGTAASVTGYWRSRRLPGQQWRLGLPSWKFTLDAVVVAIVHTALGALATAILMFVVQLAFRRLAIDPIDASLGCAVVTGVAAYMLYLAVSHLTTVSLSQRMFLFVGTGILSSMATSTDPIWWRYHISHLGALGDRPSISFNAVLIVAGVLVTTFALYVDRDIRDLHEDHVLRYGWAPPFVSALFIGMGVALAGIGVVPVNVSVTVHNTFAIALTVFFGLLMLLTPLVLRGMPWQFLVATYGFLAVLLVATWLFHGVGYLPLTTFELLAFAVLFGWISMFVRFLAALLDAVDDTPRRRSGNSWARRRVVQVRRVTRVPSSAQRDSTQPHSTQADSIQADSTVIDPTEEEPAEASPDATDTDENIGPGTGEHPGAGEHPGDTGLTR